MSTALYWLGDFLSFAQDVMLPFTPRLIPAILPNLAHHVPMIQQQALRTNQALSKVIQSLPTPPLSQQASIDKDKASIMSGRASQPVTSPTTTAPPSAALARQSTAESPPDGQPADRNALMTPRQRAAATPTLPDVVHLPGVETESVANQSSRSQSPTSTAASAGPSINTQQGSKEAQAQALTQSPTSMEQDPFDYRETVNALTIQFLSEHEETRVAALKWLIMLHQKVPKKVFGLTRLKAAPVIDLFGISDSSYGRRHIPRITEDPLRLIGRGH